MHPEPPAMRSSSMSVELLVPSVFSHFTKTLAGRVSNFIKQGNGNAFTRIKSDRYSCAHVGWYERQRSMIVLVSWRAQQITTSGLQRRRNQQSSNINNRQLMTLRCFILASDAISYNFIIQVHIFNWRLLLAFVVFVKSERLWEDVESQRRLSDLEDWDLHIEDWDLHIEDWDLEDWDLEDWDLDLET